MKCGICGEPMFSEKCEAEHKSPSPEAIYPCADCGVMRTKDEGGTTFTVCDKCWDKKHKPSPEARVDWELEARKIAVDYGETSFGEENLFNDVMKVIQAAFEKGREAR